MTAERQDGDAIDPKFARILLIHREAIAQATERACRELRAAGVDDPAAILLGSDWYRRLRGLTAR